MSADALLISCDEDDGSFLEEQKSEDTENDNFYDESADQADADYVAKQTKTTTSDAILQCPCCFQTICMDCQQHTRYKHIFRAMFVMGIAVAWDRPLRYNPTTNALQEAKLMPENRVDDSTVYYTVCCANCETVVAALDMTDEVYHFSHCLASAASSPVNETAATSSLVDPGE